MKAIQRVALFIEYKEMSIRSFEQSCGLNNGSIQAAIKRNTGIKDETMNTILDTYPEINPVWLLRGEGEMLINQIQYSPDEKNMEVNEDSDDYKQKSEIKRLEGKIDNLEKLIKSIFNLND